jgi:hypothetical protein
MRKLFPADHAGRPGQDSIAPYYLSEDYISHTDTSRGLINRLYQSVRKKTLRKKARIVKRVSRLETGRLLDLGAGYRCICQRNEIARMGSNRH